MTRYDMNDALDIIEKLKELGADGICWMDGLTVICSCSLCEIAFFDEKHCPDCCPYDCVSARNIGTKENPKFVPLEEAK